MKFSKQWLQDWVNVDIATDKLVKQLSMAGLEVGSVDSVAGVFSGVVVGEVIKVAKHPDADKLHVCSVTIGKSKNLNIVCGAANVYEHMKVAVAIVGAILSGDFKIKKAKLRGVESFGMLCSESELGLAETSNGIMDLSSDAPVGIDLRKYMQLDDVSIDVELTPNRGDCASLIGIAREVSTINNCKYEIPQIKSVKPACKKSLTVKLSAEKSCPRYVGRVIRNINTNIKTPLWLKEKLRRSGLKSIAPVVDVTNYVLLELGQPMHAFDLEKLVGEIEIRYAKKGETLKLLNDEKIKLNVDSLVIADDKKALALAGVMGGIDSAVTENTKDIFLESAFFEPVQIAKSAKHYGLQSDSSYRFERGVDYELQVKAIERVTKLLVEIVGGEPGPVVEKCAKKYLPKQEIVKLRFDRIQKILGATIPKKTVSSILKKLGMTIKLRGDVYDVLIPSYRFDCSIEVDLIEEIARIYGYENIPAHTFCSKLKVPPVSATTTPLKRLRELLQDRGYHEVITYSFIDEKHQNLLDAQHKPICILNPIANNMNVMRTNLWSGLLNVLIYNLHRQQERVRIFETGLRFVKTGKTLKQERVISGLIYGSVLPEQWDSKKQLVDFFDMKGDVEGLLHLTHNFAQFEFVAAKHSALHPGQCAAIMKEDTQIGYVGALNPYISEQLGLNNNIYLFEILLEEVQSKIVQTYQALSKFPSIRRDLAFLVDKNVNFQQIQSLVRKKAGKLLVDLTIFDVYTGHGVDSSKKSVALGLTLQEYSRTLNDCEVNEVVNKVIAVLEEKFSAELRE